jgi:type VI secretion system ImpM family protein
MNTLGFFGKIPLTGDFIHRRMNSVFMNRWDEWLKVNILHSQNMLGERWLPIYSQSPMWRFCIAPGVIDDKAYLGIMIPSVDSVGRYFPLTVVQSVEAKAIPFILSTKANQWFQNIEDLLLDLLEGYESVVQVFDTKISALQADWINDLPSIPSGLNTQDNNYSLQLEVSDAGSINHSLSSLMLQNLLGSKKGFTFWWNEGSQAYQPNILLSDHLPAQNQFCALLDGSWQEHQWVSLPLANPGQEKVKITEETPVDAEPLIQTSIDDEDITASYPAESYQDESYEIEALNSLADLHVDIDIEDITITPLATAPLATAPLATAPLATAPLAAAPKPVYHKPKNFKTQPESFGFTDPGNTRKVNEDSLLLKPSAGLWIIADGMGGHSFGSYASQLVVNRIAATDISGSPEQALNKIHIALQDVNTHLVEYAQQHEQGVCGSTVVGMLMSNQTCMFFWAGDSRLYLIRDQKISQLSKDHSVEQEKIDKGLIEKDDPNFSGKNLITRAVGGDHQLEIEIGYHQPQPGDQLFLCSDGVYNEISEQEIESIINMPNSAKERCLTMNEEIISRAARDNFTGIIVEL